LRRNNWPEWKKSFTHLVTGRGDEEVFNAKWCEGHKKEKKFRKKTSNAYTLLELCVSAELYPVVQAVNNFSDAMKDLAAACGEKSLIKLGDKLYSLIHLDYVPGTSIADHINKFQTIYTSLKSAQISTPNTQIDTAMAGIFFLKSFRFDDSLNSLIQNMYDIDPFTFEKLAVCMNLKHSRVVQSGTGSINALSSKPFIRPNKDKFKARLNTVEESEDEDVAEAVAELSNEDPDPEDTGFFVEDENTFHIGVEGKVGDTRSKRDDEMSWTWSSTLSQGVIIIQ
ncbi:hypothetical protein PTTG_30044, partial [Puccinia triticina 1-1 BBBD Race 1]